MRILFQGDSITDGNRGRNYSDFNHILGHSYAYIAAAELGSRYPEKNFDFMNRGISGFGVEQLYGTWQEDTLAYRPDVLSILIGINDAGKQLQYYGQNYPKENYVDTFESTYRLLLDRALKVNPDMKFILMEPFILDVGNYGDKYPPFEALLKEKQVIVKKIAEDYGAVFIPCQSLLNEALKKAPASYWSWDTIHPTYNGHGLLAKAWIEYASPLLGI